MRDTSLRLMPRLEIDISNAFLSPGFGNLSASQRYPGQRHDRERNKESHTIPEERTVGGSVGGKR